MEDFRIRAQHFFSDTRVVIAVSAFCFLAFMLLFNFAGTLAVNSYDYLRACLKAGGLKSHQVLFFMPNPFSFSWRLRWMYMAFGIFSLAFSARVGYLMKINFSPLSNAKVKGSRHFATIMELQDEYRCVPEKKEMYEGQGGFPIARYKNRIFIDDSPVNNLVIGTTRSGKGEIFVIPTIDIYSRAEDVLLRASMVIADPKGELSSASKATLERRGYQTYIFDLISFMGMSYNPLQLVKDAYISGNKAEAQLLANTMSNIMFNNPLAKDKTWQNWSISLTNALILALVIDCSVEAEKYNTSEERQGWYDKITMYSVARLLIDLWDPNTDEDEDNNLNMVDKFFAQRDVNDIARIQYAAVGMNPTKTKTGIYGNTLAVLTKFTMEPIAKMTAKNSVNLADIGFSREHPTAVFLVMPDYDTSNQFLASMFITQLYYVLSKKSSVSPGGRCSREVVFLLDEFGQFVIPDMAHILTVCTGRNIRFDLIIQAYSQIFKLYGEQDGRTIIGNCGNQIYLLTIEEDTAKRISSLIGNKTITVLSRSEKRNLSLDKNVSEHVDTQPLLNPNELMEFRPGESVVVRITKRTDLKGRKITPSPIFNHGETEMKYRYEYLGDDFDPHRSFQSLNISDQCLHKNLDLSSILYTTQQTEKDKIKEATIQSADPFLSEIMTLQQQDLISRFIESNGYHTSEIRWDVTMTTFDEFLQTLYDKEQISHQTFDDVYAVLDGAATSYKAARAERSDFIETAS